MKIIIFVIALLLVCTVFGGHNNPTYYDNANPLDDIDPDSAPPAGQYFDISNNTAYLRGINGSKVMYDPAPPVPVGQFGNFVWPPTSNPPEHAIANAQSLYVAGELFIHAGVDYVQFISQDKAYFIIETDTDTPFCFNVANYNYSVYARELKKLRRIGTVILPFNGLKNEFRRQIDDAFGRHNNMCDDKKRNIREPDADEFYEYTGSYFDISAPGFNSGCQNQDVAMTIKASAYAYECYGQLLPHKIAYNQFYPYLRLTGDSDRDVIQGVLKTFETYATNQTLVIQAYNLVNSLCNTPADYCTNFFNSGCRNSFQAAQVNCSNVARASLGKSEFSKVFRFH